MKSQIRRSLFVSLSPPSMPSKCPLKVESTCIYINNNLLYLPLIMNWSYEFIYIVYVQILWGSTLSFPKFPISHNRIKIFRDYKCIFFSLLRSCTLHNFCRQWESSATTWIFVCCGVSRTSEKAKDLKLKGNELFFFWIFNNLSYAEREQGNIVIYGKMKL